MKKIDLKKAIEATAKEVKKLPQNARANKYLAIALLQEQMLRQARNKKATWQSLADSQERQFPKLPKVI